jgi:hypothetical protein
MNVEYCSNHFCDKTSCGRKNTDGHVTHHLSVESVLETAANHKLESAGPQISSLAIKRFIILHDEIHLKSTRVLQKINYSGKSDQAVVQNCLRRLKRSQLQFPPNFPKPDDTKVTGDGSHGTHSVLPRRRQVTLCSHCHGDRSRQLTADN